MRFWPRRKPDNGEEALSRQRQQILEKNHGIDVEEYDSVEEAGESTAVFTLKAIMEARRALTRKDPS